MAIDRGFVLPLEQRHRLYRRIRRGLPAAIWNVSMVGHRILIAQDKASEMARGIIHKPRQTVIAEQQAAGSGYIIAVGPRVGMPGAPHPVGIECEDPQELLGLHCYYASWTGKVFRTDEADGEFDTESHLVIMTDRDVQALDEGDDPGELTDKELESIYKAASEQGLL